MCDGDHDDLTTVWIDEWIRARKPRGCCACEIVIQPGEIYHMHKTLADGVWSKWDHCQRCWTLCKALWKKLDGGGIELDFTCGETWESPPPEIEALAFALPAEMQALARLEYAANRRTTCVP